MSTPKKLPADKEKVGRKEIEITADHVAQAETLAGQGMTTEQIAMALGLGYSTMFEKMKRFPELAEAIKKGKAIGLAMVTEKLLEKCMMLDSTAILFYLKCQGGGAWRDTQHIEMDASIDLSGLTDEQLDALAQGKAIR